MSLQTFIKNNKGPFEAEMLTFIQDENIPSPLKESMMYSLSVGGKRLRPILLFSILESLNIPIHKGYRVASALEMIHTYSLIHDDLPAMDDDELRRGKPTNHIVFGEATAILAGDSLLTQAFEIIGEDETLSHETRLKIIVELSKAAGPMGMVAGQVLDMEAENKTVTIEQLKNIHVNKTGKLIEFSLVSGAIIADLSQEDINLLRQYAYHIGLAFQIKDDILDIEGNEELIGKTIGSDLTNGKSTYVTLTSLEQAKKMLQAEIEAGRSVLQKLSFNTSLLHDITAYIKDREA
ncbi:MAG TPA: geranyl transferase [Firmicutes bacterium]|nr:geranyl transferase [Bacillota bacterium]